MAGIASDVTQRKQVLEEMHESGRRFRDLLRNVQLASVMLDCDARITFCNEYLLHLTGWRLEEILGRNWFDLFVPPELADMKTLWADLLTNVPTAWHHENEIFTRARQRRLIRWNNSVLRSLAGDVIGTASIGEDITERTVAERRVVYLSRVYAVLSGINSLIARARDRGELFRDACRIAIESGGLSMAMLVIVNPTTMQIISMDSAGVGDDLLTSIKAVLSSRESMQTTMVARSIREKKPFVSNDLLDDPRVLFAKAYIESGVRSLVVVPLIVAAEPVGVLALYASETGFFHDEEMKLLSELAGDISFAIDHLEKAERLNYLAYYDPLTGLANRALFLELLQQSVANSGAQNGRLALLFLDIERFKTINDTLGRLAGDVLLKEVAARMSAYPAAAGNLARIEADHFAIVVPNVTSEEGLAHRIQLRLGEIFDQPFLVGDSELRVFVKIGIAMFPDDGADAETLFKNAEAALQNAKAMGNRYLFYEQRMNERVAEKLALENQLRGAIENHEFVLYYQPKIELKSGRIAGLEALLRWQRPQQGLISPQGFLDILEETGLIVRVGSWVIAAACRQMGLWARSSIGPVQVAVNVAGHQFIDGNLEREVIQALDDNGIDGEQLQLELTESSLMANTVRNIAALRNLRKRGVQVAIDDFGTGYSSLAYLRHFPIDELKIDIAFIRDVTSNPDDASIVQAIIRMAHSLKLEVVAEGVETAGQLAYLRRQGCDHMQGFYFSPAVPVPEIEQMLRDEKRLPAVEGEERDAVRTLLLVDDEASVLTSLQRLLRHDGYHILSAQSAAEAFELLAQHPVHGILCDQRMPNMSGTVFLDRVKDLYPTTLRIVLSGYTDLESIIDAINRGAIYRFYTKPWNNKLLRDNIREAFRHYELLQAGVEEESGAIVHSSDRVATKPGVSIQAP
ncbi:MAG: EAL domain-containing protein [Rudaea sp.]|nr:EAL domain-containing protein [Rudaea sp.]